MMNPLQLLTMDAEAPFLFSGGGQRAAGEMALGWVAAGLVVRVTRGPKMRNWQGLFDEFAAALQFPAYFGENVDAFDECMADLAWIPPLNGYVIVVSEADQVLLDADPGALGVLVSSLRRASRVWAQPVALGEWWDRSAIPFHVVLQSGIDDPAKRLARWIAAGAAIAPLVR